jgi:hypothetical protein
VSILDAKRWQQLGAALDSLGDLIPQVAALHGKINSARMEKEMAGRGWEFDQAGGVARRGAPATPKGPAGATNRAGQMPVAEGRATPTGAIRGEFLIPAGTVVTDHELGDVPYIGEDGGG